MDTIAAIATASGAAAVGIVRLSGDKTRDILGRLFSPMNGTRAQDLPPRRMTYGVLRDAEGRTLDRVLATVFSAEHSYTGEESAELYCHGSPVVLGEVLRAAFAAGARQARAGEFTKRAFLNGKMDLTEAEAVIDLIDAETAEAARNAAAQLSGALRKPLEEVYDALLDLTSRFYAVVDYPDEDIEDIHPEQIGATLARAEKTLADLLGTFARGRVLKSGVATAIIGAPNAGKSSLLNALVGYERAIVTDIAGTTRDTVEEKAVLGGTLLRLIDTAGLRETADTVEKLGVERSRKAAEVADLILCLADGSRALGEDDMTALRIARGSGKPWIFVQTKKDLTKNAVSLGIVGDKVPCVAISSVTGEGIDALSAQIAALYPTATAAGETLLTNARQAEIVERALGSIRAANEAFLSGIAPDAVLTEIEQAQSFLGELTGRTARSDMVERIFERFCVGK